MFYTTISLIKYLCMCLLNKYYRNCGGYHDSDCIAVLVMVSKAESIVLYLSTCIMYTCQNKDFLPSLTITCNDLRKYLAFCTRDIDPDKVHKR